MIEENQEIVERRRPMVNNAFERHAQTALTSLVVLLLAGVVALIFKINEDQVQQLIEIRALQYQVEGIAKAQAGGNGYSEREIARINSLLSTIWPRLRASHENIEILKRAYESQHDHSIQLNDPEKF